MEPDIITNLLTFKCDKCEYTCLTLNELSEHFLDRHAIMLNSYSTVRATTSTETTQQKDSVPVYYRTNDYDLYKLFYDHFGAQATGNHLLMEAIQYLWRCQSKGTYIEDLIKTRVILDRLIKEAKQISGQE